VATVPATIVVHVAGAVTTPGVYRLPSDARVEDAIVAAGGPVFGADVDSLNRAQRLIDGQRIGVPLIGQTDGVADGPGIGVSGGTPATTADGGAAPGGVTDGSSSASGTGIAVSATQPVNLNTATQAELETLPGVGPSIAGAIIAERDARGGFGTPRDLLDVRGIGESRLAQLEPLVTV
jgi:competence protein ComEA